MSTTPNNDAPASEALAAKSQQSGISGRMLAIFYLIAIVLGIVNGIWGSSATQSFADFIATMFIRLFKFVAIPIIAVSIISTLSSISKSRSSGPHLPAHDLLHALHDDFGGNARRSALRSLFTGKRLRIDFRCCRSTAFKRC